MSSDSSDLPQADPQGKKLTNDELKRLEKVDLHRHLEGSLRLSTLLELAPKVGLDVPMSPQTQAKKFLVTEQMKDLTTVLEKFWMTQAVLSSEEILTRVTYEAIEDAYLEGIRILELRYAPSFIQKNHEFLSYQQIHQAIKKGVKLAEKFPLAVGLICILQRTLPLEVGSRIGRFAIDNKDSFVGIDLADDEDAVPAREFEKIFVEARAAGLPITIHAGESNSAMAPLNVIDAIEILGAQRIGHGVQITKNPKALHLVREKNVPLELCVTSNWLTNAVGNLDEHPFKKLMHAGVLTTINSDDPGIFGINLTNEYHLLHHRYGLTLADFNRCNDIAAQASFIPLIKRQKYWPRPIHKI